MKEENVEIDGPGFWGKSMAILILFEGILPVLLAVSCGWKVEIKLKERK